MYVRVISVIERGTRQRRWLRHFDTSRNVVLPIPDKVIGFFNWLNHSCRTRALGSTEPVTEMSTRVLPGGKQRSTLKADNLTAICERIV
jgi:hypothetical protein